MNINKMTEKLQQGLVNAQSLATSLHHQEIDTPHLLIPYYKTMTD